MLTVLHSFQFIKKVKCTYLEGEKLMLLHALIPASRVNGPGLRTVVFLQGCNLGCRGCWNPRSHRFEGPEVTVGTVVKTILRADAEFGLDGVTFSGGEPMQQADSLSALIRTLKSRVPEFSFGMFSGYTERELDQGHWTIWRRDLDALEKVELWRAIRTHLDFAVLGRFNQNQPSTLPLRTSRNQVLRLFSRRYTVGDFGKQSVEVSIHEDGHGEITGFPVFGLPW
jgi:anaerobic ribonucleoside-triphosphate reductase activating protein